MKTIDSEKEQEIKETLSNDQQKWFTVSEIADKTGLHVNVDELQEMLNTSADFVQSTRSLEGKNVYATKKDFEDSTSFFTKLKGAFRNRID